MSPRLTTTPPDALFYDVYTHVAELHLAGVGIDVEWTDVDVADQEAVRWGETRKYFSMRLYRLPIGKIRIAIPGRPAYYCQNLGKSGD